MTLRRALRYAVWIPVLAVLIDFALSNTGDVDVGLFPTGMQVVIPLAFAILGALAIGFLIGGAFAWVPSLRHRRAASKAQDALRVMEAKHEELKARVSGALSTPPR